MRRKHYVLDALKEHLTHQEKEGGITINIGSATNISIARDVGKSTIVSGGEECKMTQEERSRHYRVCHAIAKQLDLYSEMRQYMLQHWRADSMRRLSDQALAKLLDYMLEFERRASR